MSPSKIQIEPSNNESNEQHGTTNGLHESSVLYRQLHDNSPRIVGSKGNYLITDDGVKIFDATGGAAVSCIGHGDHRVKQAIIEQIDEVDYCYSQFFTSRSTEKLSQMLTESTNGLMSRVFVVSSGTEAVEAGLKLARQYFTELPVPQIQRTNFIARKQSYHGNTLGALSTGAHVARRALYKPMLTNNITHVSPCYAYRGMTASDTFETYVSRLSQELEDEFQRLGPDTVCAFVAETVSGGTLGCVPPVPGYLRAMKEVCDRHGALFFLDEVMSGMGRTGTLHAWQQEDVFPDLQTIGKGLGAGYAPIGALLINRRVVDVLEHGSGAFSHSQTYQGHPIACAAACAVQQIVTEENMIKNCSELGAYLGQLLKEKLGDHPNVGDIRGRGLFWGVEFVQRKETKEPFPVKVGLSWTLHATGLLPEFCISLLPGNGTADGINGDHIIIAPAYNVSREDIETIVSRTDRVVRHVLKSVVS